jgi:polysaccharide biosynthesis transport protein
MPAEERISQPDPEVQGLTLSEYFDVLKRRRWLLIIPAVLVFALAAIVTMILPTKYESRATILIEQPEIATDLVRTTVTGLAEQRMQVISQRVLSRENLRAVIEKHDLYPDEREANAIEDVVRTMRRHISLEMVREEQGRGRLGPNSVAFVLAYEGQSPELAQQVVAELTTLFLNENVQQRQQAARDTTRFLTQEAARLSQEIVEVEARLSAFKEANMTSLPEMQNLNMNLMQRTEEDLRRNDQNVRTLDERIIFLQSQIADMNPSRHMDRVRALEAEYATLAALYTERHPDRLRVQRELETLRNELGISDVIAPGNNPAYDQLQSQLQNALSERRVLLAARTELRQKLDELEGRLSLTPVIEVEYRSLTREHDTAVDKLRDLRAKELQAQLAESLEAESKSERFMLIEPASLPYRPSSPNRQALLLLGFVFAVGGGAGTVFLRENLDHAVHGPKGVARATGVPPLAVIPYIAIDEDRARARQRMLLLIFGGIALAAAVTTVFHYQIQPLDELYVELLERAGVDMSAPPAVAPDRMAE